MLCYIFLYLNVRPIFEYGAVIYMYLIDAVKKVQRNFTKKLSGLCNMTHLQRLNVCNIESLEERRIKIDLIWMYKILHNLISINLGNNIKLSVNSNNRGNMYKLYKCNFRFDVKNYFFCNRVINICNSLPNAVVRLFHPLNINLKTLIFNPS